MNRRELMKGTLAGAAAMAVERSPAIIGAPKPSEESLPPPITDTRDIYRRLGFATMTGESPRTMWARLRNTKGWLAGPLAPDAWAGQVFVADHADIFAFRTLRLPRAWMGKRESHQNLTSFGVEMFSTLRSNWFDWWRTVGPRAHDDSYARLIWQMPDGGPEVTYEWARTGPNEIVCRFQQSEPSSILIQCHVPWGSAPPKCASIYSESQDRQFLRGRSWVPGTRDGMRWVAALSKPVEESAGTGVSPYFGLLNEVESLYICARQGQDYETLEEQTRRWLKPGEIDRLLDRNRAAYLGSRTVGKGWLDNAAAAINDQVVWSEVYTPERRRTYITVSRRWAKENNSAPDFHWDSFFNALLVCQEDERKAFDLLRDITLWQNEQGMFCQYGQWLPRPEGFAFPVAWGHTQYPVGTLATAKIYLRRPNRAFLEEIYPRLLKSHRWWFSDRGDGQPWRDGNRNGLLELGSNYPQEIPYAERQQVAYYESHDDSPEWSGVAPYNETTNTIELDTVERNCLYTMDAYLLAWMARELGRTEEASKLEREHALMAERINQLLWDASRNVYANRRWHPQNGNLFMPQIAPDVFFSLLAKVALPERAESLRRLFHASTKFAGEWILPTISRDDPAYPGQNYWRGKVWPPINWLAYQGFKIFEWDREAHLLAESSAKMFLKPWRERGECHENFFSTTGKGSSDPHYTWGALLAQIAVEELIDISPWHGLRFGNLDPVAGAGVERYFVAGSLYAVSQMAGKLEVRRDNKLLFQTNAPAELRHVSFRGKQVQFQIRATQEVILRLGLGSPRKFPQGTTKSQGALA